MLEICKTCPLYQHYNGLCGYVPSTDTPGARYALIGEAPGEREVERGLPFVGQSGQEQDQYLAHANLTRGLFNIRNIVQCRPPKNRDPKPDEIAHCSQFLLTYLRENRPEIIGAVGRFAARWFLGDSLSMEYDHGIPVRAHIADYDPTIVPIYHPAAGIRSTTLMELIRQDYDALGRVIKREIKPRPEWPKRTSLVNAVDFPHFPADIPEVVAVDTETMPDGSPWCLTYCLDSDVYRGRIIMADDLDNINKFNALVNRPGVTTVLHNALFDLPVLETMGVKPRVYHDTMVMAYLLQDLPLGLKPLSYRLLGMVMRKYKDMIKDAQQIKAVEYLTITSLFTWDNPKAVLEWVKGYPRVKQPQNISKKIARILKTLDKNPELNVAAKWKAINYSGGRGQVEQALGPVPQASLADIEFSDALQYACADAVATYQVYYILRDRITEMELWNTFNRDMRVIPVLVDMMSEGILLDKDHLAGLAEDYSNKLELVDQQINDIYTGDERLNPGSTQQVARALYSMGVYPSPTTSTNTKTMDLYRDKHEIVNLISRWRELSKLQSTYISTLPLKADSSGRVHSKFSNTNTVTGRLTSSKPNLQNIPTRTEEGRQIRHAFIAQPGCSLVALDYSQIEMRCMAHVAEDQTMIQMFWDNADIHSETAARMLKIPLEQVDAVKHRRPAKSVGFGVAYAMGPLGLQAQMKAQGVDYSERECQDLIAAWYGVYPGIYNYMNRVKSEARRNGLVRDCFGRYRLVPEVLSSLQRVVNAGLRQAGNFPIQSMAQQIIKQAMGDLRPIYQELQSGGHRCHCLLQIHDELVWEIENGLIDVAVPVIKEVMENAVELVMPTPVDYNVGHSWGELK